MPRGLKNFGLAEIKAVSKFLGEVSTELEKFVEILDLEKFTGQLQVDAGDTMQLGIANISSFVGKIQAEYRNSKIPQIVGPPRKRGRPKKESAEIPKSMPKQLPALSELTGKNITDYSQSRGQHKKHDHGEKQQKHR